MGRGRAKAKQRKVARELKYYSPNSDLSALEQELRGTGGQVPHGATEADDDDEDDEYSDYEDRWADDDEDEDRERR